MDPTTTPKAHAAPSVPANEAKTNLGQLLDRVESGDIITITRHGEPIARLVPFHDAFDRPRIQQDLEALSALSARVAARGASMSQEEIRAAIEEGRP